MATIKDKYPTYQDFWTEYRQNYLDTNKDLAIRTIAVSILHNLYNPTKVYWPFFNIKNFMNKEVKQKSVK